MAETEELPKKKKKKRGDDGGGGDDFMLMFTALMIIVLAFFILLNTMAVVDDSKSRVALGSLRGSFGILPGGMMFDADGSLLDRRQNIIDEMVIISIMVRDLEILAWRRKLGSPGDIRVDKEGLYPRVTIASHVLYPSDGVEISPKAFPILDRIAEAAKTLGRPMRIEGHTREPLPDDPPWPDSWARGTVRAVNIQRYFLEASRLSPRAVVAEGVSHFRSKGVPNDHVVISFAQKSSLKQEKDPSTMNREDKSDGP